MIASETSVVSRLRRSAWYARFVLRFEISSSGLLEMNTEIRGINKNASSTAMSPASTRRPSVPSTDGTHPFSKIVASASRRSSTSDIRLFPPITFEVPRALAGPYRAEFLFNPLFFILEVEEYVLGKADGMFFRQVNPAVGDHRLQFFHRRFGHPDHHLRFAQSLLALGFRERLQLL